MEKKILHCINCHFYTSTMQGQRCFHPLTNGERIEYLVNPLDGIPAISVRGPEGCCGPKGELFEQIPTSAQPMQQWKSPPVHPACRVIGDSNRPRWGAAAWRFLKNIFMGRR